MIAGFIIAFPKHGQKELVQICFNCVTFCHMDCDFATLVCRVIHLFVNVVCFFLPRHVSRIRYAVLHDSVATDRDRKLSVLMWVFPAAPLTSSFVTDPEIKPLYCQRLPFFFFQSWCRLQYSFACFSCWLDFSLPLICLSSSFNCLLSQPSLM